MSKLIPVLMILATSGWTHAVEQATAAGMPGDEAVPLAAAKNPGLAGLWCVEANPKDCLKLTVTGPESVSGSFLENGTVYSEAVGFARGDKLSMAFRRTNSPDLGFVTFILRNATTADSRTFNPDGSQRWRGVYLKR
jgi:hypothetical protein